MGVVRNIENRLIEINETVFQELCDSLLILKNENYVAFSRSCSQAGKQKTRKLMGRSQFTKQFQKSIIESVYANLVEGDGNYIKGC